MILKSSKTDFIFIIHNILFGSKASVLCTLELAINRCLHTYT